MSSRGLWTSGDRWTCPDPDCGETEVVDSVSDVSVGMALRVVQERHAARHAAERMAVRRG